MAHRDRGPHLASGLDEGEVLEAAARQDDEMTSAIRQALLAIYYAHQGHAWTDVFVATEGGPR